MDGRRLKRPHPSRLINHREGNLQPAIDRNILLLDFHRTGIPVVCSLLILVESQTRYP